MSPPPPPPSAVRIPDVSISDFNPTPAKRTLILCPPTVSSNPEVLQNALATVNRDSTDVQMLDRLALNLATLPDGIYSTVLLLSDPSTNAPTNLEKSLLEKVLAAMAPGGRWRSQGDKEWAADRLKFLTTGFLVEESAEGEGVVVVKPDFGGQKSMTLNLRKRQGGAVSVVKPVVAPKPTPKPVTGNGVGFVDFGDDLEEDDELIDEDELMADENLATPVQIRMFPRPPSTPTTARDGLMACSGRVSAKGWKAPTGL
jgi:hypothetical protein